MGREVGRVRRRVSQALTPLLCLLASRFGSLCVRYASADVCLWGVQQDEAVQHSQHREFDPVKLPGGGGWNRLFHPPPRYAGVRGQVVVLPSPTVGS